MLELLVLTLADLLIAALGRNMSEVIPIARLRGHLVLDPDITIRALTVRLHHELVVLAILCHTFGERLILFVSFDGSYLFSSAPRPRFRKCRDILRRI